MSNADSTAAATSLSDADRAWVRARVAELGGDAAQVHAGPLAADANGRIVLSADPADSLVAPVQGTARMLLTARTPLLAMDLAEARPAASVMAVEAIRVGEGESLVVQCPEGQPVAVVAGALEVAPGGRVLLETHTELHAARAVFAGDGPIVLVGADGASGKDGGNGAPGNGNNYDGGNAGSGGPGISGEPGPGGTFFFDHLTGALTIIAGGGSGGNGGNGGRGGDGRMGGRTSEGGNGGNGGNGGDAGSAGDGGTIVISFRTIDPDASIQPVVRVPRPGVAGRGGGHGDPGGGMYPGRSGSDGRNGAPGKEGAPPVFKIRVQS